MSVCICLLLQLALNVIDINTSETQNETPDPQKLYPIFVRMIEDANILDEQFVAALMISPSEASRFDENRKVGDQYKDRFKAYANTEKDHGEIQLLNELDQEFFKNYEEEETPWLLLFTTNIPCHRCGSCDETYCARTLKEDVEERKLNKDPRKKYKLVIAFISVYSRMTKKGTRYDITDLETVLRLLTSDDDIYLAYFISKSTDNLLPKHKNSQNKLVEQQNQYSLSSWIEWATDSENQNRLRSRYPQTSPLTFVQDALLSCLDVFLGQCSCVAQSIYDNSNNVLRYATDWAMKKCIHGEDAPCKNGINPLRGSKSTTGSSRHALNTCLKDKWVSKLTTVQCTECRGPLRNIVRTCVEQSVSAQEVGCPPRQNHESGWVECKIWDTNYDNLRFDNKPRCPLRGGSPEYLCQAEEDPGRKRRKYG